MVASALSDQQHALGGVFGDAPLPLHFGDLAAEYAAAHEAAVLIDRSDEGLVAITGADRLTIVNRISTNAVGTLAAGEGRATVFTTSVGRIIDRVVLYNLDDEHTLVRTSAGRDELIAAYLRRNIFFRDKMQVEDRSAAWVQLALYGPAAAKIAAALVPGAASLPVHGLAAATFQDEPLWAVSLDPLTVPGVGLIAPEAVAVQLWLAVLQAGQPLGVQPAGSVVYELMRIAAGRPGPAGELTEEYIPLEAGLWPDVSFNKGCYTGQEIIARMESRSRLAKTLVGVTLSGPVEVGTSWSAGGKKEGSLTSVARRPDGAWIGLGFARPDVAEVGQTLACEPGVTATVTYVPRRAPVT